jgi:hypothetical protein
MNCHAIEEASVRLHRKYFAIVHLQSEPVHRKSVLLPIVLVDVPAACQRKPATSTLAEDG